MPARLNIRPFGSMFNRVGNAPRVLPKHEPAISAPGNPRGRVCFTMEWVIWNKFLAERLSMKQYGILTLCFLTALLSGCGGQKGHVGFSKKMIVNLREINDLLEKINTVEDVDKFSEQVKKLVKRMSELKQELAGLPAPSDREKKAIAELKPSIMHEQSRLLENNKRFKTLPKVAAKIKGLKISAR